MEVRWSVEAKIFHALSDDTRIWLLRTLSKKDMTVQELTEKFNEEVGEMDYSNMLRHLKILENIGMTKQRQSKNDPYSLDAPIIVEFHVNEGGKWDYELCWGPKTEGREGLMHKVHNVGSSNGEHQAQQK